MKNKIKYPKIVRTKKNLSLRFLPLNSFIKQDISLYPIKRAKIINNALKRKSNDPFIKESKIKLITTITKAVFRLV